MYAMKRVDVVRRLLDLAGIGAGRLQLRWVSAAEGQVFAELVKEISALTTQWGPFVPERFRLQLGAVEAALNAPRLRWLMGIDRRITEKENVYHERVEERQFHEILEAAVEMEYQKALILQALKDGPLSVPELSAATGLPVYTVSLRLGDLEGGSQVDLYGYEGTTPRFVSLAA